MPTPSPDPFAPAPPDVALTAALRALDQGDFVVTDFEADILESVMRQRTWASVKQRTILAPMLERYRCDSDLAMAVRGF